MLTLKEIEQTALAVGRETFGAKAIASVHAEADIDSAGRDAVEITFVMNTKSSRALSGSRLLPMMAAFRQRMWDAGETWTPKFRYATEQEWAEVGDPES
jgi:hypothetical protein